MIFNCEITNFIKPINNQILIDYVELKSYIVIFMVPSLDKNDEDIQFIIIKKHESLNQIREYKIQNQSLIITYDSNIVMDLNYIITLSKLIFYTHDSLIIDFLSDINNKTYYEPELQNELNCFYSEKIIKLLLLRNPYITTPLESIKKIKMINPVYDDSENESTELDSIEVNSWE